MTNTSKLSDFWEKILVTVLRLAKHIPGLRGGNVWKLFRDLLNLPENFRKNSVMVGSSSFIHLHSLIHSFGYGRVIFENLCTPEIKILCQYVGKTWRAQVAGQNRVFRAQFFFRWCWRESWVKIFRAIWIQRLWLVVICARKPLQHRATTNQIIHGSFKCYVISTKYFGSNLKFF